MSYALLFSGQGTQHAGMLPWLENEPACSKALASLQAVVGADWRLAMNDEARRTSNAFAQPLIVGTSLAAWAALQARLVEPPTVVAGYSVGEVCAFAGAAVFTPAVAVDLAVARAAAMDAACAGMQGGLLSVSGLSPEAVLLACPDLDCAIRIAADQGIYAGPVAALQHSALALAARGALCKPLEVRVPSHSHWMADAAKAFAYTLQDTPFARPASPIAPNASGVATRQTDALRQALSAQIATTVQWAACMDAVAEQGVRCVMEIGAGTALSKMWNQRYPCIPARSLEEFRDPAGAAQWLERASAS